MMTFPPYLKRGDVIGLVSPAGVIDESSVIKAAELIENEGFRVKIGANAYKAFGSLAGTDEERASDLQRMLDDKEVRAILFTRGGYGSIRILPYLLWDFFQRSPKWLCGYSDITVFHSFLKTLGFASIHSDMVKDILEVPEAKENLMDLLWLLQGERINLPGSLSMCDKDDLFAAPLLGGNLSILSSLRGTPYDLNPEGSYLFLEEVGEYRYEIDRMLINLSLSDWFQKTEGVVWGGFTDIKANDPEFPYTLDELFNYHTPGKPVVMDFPAGHLARNYPLILGGSYKISV